MTRINTRSIGRRILTLEARLNTGPSAEEKWAAIHQSALALMSGTEIELLNQAWVLSGACSTGEYTLGHHDALARSENAQDRAFAESDARFTIAEVDEMLIA